MRYFVLLIVLAMSLPITAQTVYTGKLDNGLTYYLAKTDSKTINFQLIQNIGAVVEQKSESGYAHFMEHMSFHASKNFPNGTRNYTKRNNIISGASTYKDKIIYSLKHIDPDIVSVDSCIYMLHDWGSFLKIKPEDIESEKKIVEQEWRSGQQNNEMTNEIVDLIYNHSPLALSSTLGDMEVVKAATRDSLKQFYNKWFVPNLQAIYIEGNIDIKEYEDRIKACYEDLKDCKQTKKEDIVIEDNDEIYLKTANLRTKYSSLEIASRLDFFDYSDKDDFLKKKIYTQLYNLVMNLRLDNYHLNNRNVFQNYLIEYNGFHKGYSLLAFVFKSYQGKELECLSEIVSNHNHICNEGFSKQEIELFSAGMVTLLDIDRIEKPYLIAEDNFLMDFPLYSIEDIVGMCKKLEDSFDNTDFVEFCRTNFKLKNTLVVSKASPSSNDLIRDGHKDVLNSKKANPKEYQNQVIVFEKSIEENISFDETSLNNGICHLRLNNGLEIYYKQSDADSTVINGFAPGGTSVYAKGNIPFAESFPEIMNSSNIGDYNIVDVDLYRKKNVIKLNFSIDEYFNRVNASCPTKNSEALFSLLFNKVSNSTCNDLVFEKYKEDKAFRNATTKKNKKKEEIIQEVYGVNPREPYFSSMYFDNFDIDQINTEFQKQYNNASNWCYVIESNLPLNEFKKKYLKYFSNIKNKGIKQEYTVYKEFKLKKDIRKIEAYGGANGGGIVYNIFLNRELSAKEVLSLHILQFIVKRRCLEEFRVKRSALYGMFTQVENSFSPENMHTLYINLGLSKSNVIPFVDFVNTNIKSIKNSQVSEEEVEKAKLVFAKRNYHTVKNNLVLESCVSNYLKRTEYEATAPDRLMDEISVEDIIDIAKLLYKKGKKVEYLFN